MKTLIIIPQHKLPALCINPDYIVSIEEIVDSNIDRSKITLHDGSTRFCTTSLSLLLHELDTR